MAEWVQLARILGARGNRGEVAAAPLTNRWERLKENPSVVLVRDNGLEKPAKVEEVWLHKDRLIFKLEGVDSISAAEVWKGAAVCVPLEERPELPPDEYYQSDLIGCSVFQQAEPVGTVVDCQEYGGPLLIEVERPGRSGTTLIPLVPSICVLVDVAAKRIEIDPPEGLMDLDRE